MPRRVLVTGMGVLTAIGDDVPSFAQALAAGRCGIGTHDGGGPARFSARLAPFALGERLQALMSVPQDIVARARTSAGRAPRAAQAAVLCALQAFAQAGLFASAADPEKIGLVVAGQNIQPAYSYGLYSKFQAAPEYLPPSYALHFMDTDHLGILSEILSIRGEGFTTGGASASGNVGIVHGMRQVRAGLADICVVLGALAELSPMELQALHALGAMGGKRPGATAEEACRPFDVEHDGFIYGQGVGCLILESESSAARRGAAALAELAGGAMCLDGTRQASPSVEGEGRAMRLALADAGLAPADIDYVNAHGTASPLGDETELAALRATFRDCLDRVVINSTKGLTGHCLWSAGVVEAIATVVQMSEGFIHPNLHLVQPIDSACRLAGPRSVPARLRAALSNSFGFGGINSAIVLKRIHP